MKHIKKFIFAAAATIVSMTAMAKAEAPMMRADVLRDTVPSNYGNWVNLTDGYTQDKNYNTPKMEVAFDGNTIHLCWVELEKVDHIRNIWYRRSTDNGKTWEDARLVLKSYESYSSTLTGISKLMTASNGKVHIAAIHDVPTIWGENARQGSTTIHYLRSDDGGATFGEVQSIGHYSGDLRYDNTLIQSDGNTVVIATSRSDYNGKYIQNYFYSTDGGESFKTLTHATSSGSEYGLLDLQVSGERFAAMYKTGSWYSGLIEGKMMILVSDGNDLSATNIAPLCTKQNGDEVTYACPVVMTGSNGDLFDYHPQMVLDGETIQVVFQGNPGLEVIASGGLDFYYTLYRRSDDFGATWKDVVVLPEANGGFGTMAAKGENVYVVTRYNGKHTVYHSNDGGASFEAVTQTIFPDNYCNPERCFHLAIDPTDETGQHAYFTGNRFFFVETHDGFRTISRNFCLGAESWSGTYYSNNQSLKVYLDDEGQEHWFMHYMNTAIEPNENGGYTSVDGSRDIVYRRAEAEPEPAAEDMALNLRDYSTPHHRVVVPMSPSLQQKQAITVECWIRPDNRYGFQIAACTDSKYQEGSVFAGGWYIVQVPTYSGELFYEGGICIDTDEFTKGVRVHYDWPTITVEPEAWHHVALTYDDNIEKDNVCMYIDGKLAATNTIHGNMVLGKNPITLGRTNGYNESEALLDNFAIWNRALSAEEVLAHASDPKAFDGKDDDCRLFLTFDGTLQDQSQYGNDAVALQYMSYTGHEEIIPASIFAPAYDINPASDYIYSIDGRLMNGIKNLPKGIYIRNGEKIIIR